MLLQQNKCLKMNTDINISIAILIFYNFTIIFFFNAQFFILVKYNYDFYFVLNKIYIFLLSSNNNNQNYYYGDLFILINKALFSKIVWP